MKKFKDGDIFVNSVKTYPKVKLFGYNGKIYINNTNETAVRLNDFLPEPPPPPPPPLPTEAPAIVSSNTYVNTIEYDIYPIDFSSIPSGNGYVLLQASPSIYTGVIFSFRRDDANSLVTCLIYDYASSSPAGSPYTLPISQEISFYSDGTNWIVQ